MSSPPAASARIDDSTGMRLRALWQAAKRSGYRVLENRAFDGPPNEDLWFRTIELQSEEDSDERTILTIWQQPPKDIDPFYIVKQWPREAIDEHVRKWIEVEGTHACPRPTSSCPWPRCTTGSLRERLPPLVQAPRRIPAGDGSRPGEALNTV